MARGGIILPGWLYNQLKDYYTENEETLKSLGIKSVNNLATKIIEVGLEALSGHFEPIRKATVDALKCQNDR